MRFFGSSDDAPLPSSSSAEIMAKLDSALTAIFNEDGKKTVLYYLQNKYNLSLEEASVDPGRLEKALTGLLGQVGWMVVKKAILEKFWERKIELREMQTVERTSLRTAFGIVRGFGSIRLAGF